MDSVTWTGPFTLHTMGGEGNDETPVGEGTRRDPTGSETSEEARQFPHRKASYFLRHPPLTVNNGPNLSLKKSCTILEKLISK